MIASIKTPASVNWRGWGGHTTNSVIRYCDFLSFGSPVSSGELSFLATHQFAATGAPAFRRGEEVAAPSLHALMRFAPYSQPSFLWINSQYS